MSIAMFVCALRSAHRVLARGRAARARAAARARRQQPKPVVGRQRHALHRRLPEPVLDHRRGHREGRRQIPFKSGIPRRTTLSRDRKRFYTIEAEMEKVEILDIASRETVDTFTLSEGNKKVRIRSLEPDPLHRFVMMVTASATKLIDRFEIGPPTLVQYDLKRAQDHPHHPVAERRGAREREHPVLARRQADVPVQRPGRADLRHDELQAGGQVGAVEADRGGLRPRSTSARATSLNDEPGFYTGDLQRRRIRCSTAASWASAASTWRRRASTSTRSARPRGSASRWRRTARSPTACSRRSAATSSGRSISSAASVVGAHRVQGPAAHVAQDQLERQGALHLQRRQHDRPLRRRRPIKYLRHDHARRRHDDATCSSFPQPPAQARAPSAASSARSIMARPRLCAARSRFVVARTGGGSRSCWRSASSAPALSLYLPLLSRDFFDRALHRPRPRAPASASSALFAAVTRRRASSLNVVSGLRYTRVSADILFDMRLAMYRHLQRLSPRFYARTRLGDIMSRINNDIGEIQRVAAETALAWVGNVLFLVGTVVMLAWLDCAAVRSSPRRPRRSASGRSCTIAGGSRSDVAVLRAAQRRHRQLPDRDAAGRAAGRHRRTRRTREVAALPRSATTRSSTR